MADAARTLPPLPPARAERVITLDVMGAVGDVARPLGPIERLTNITGVRRLIVLVVLATAWEAYARCPNPFAVIFSGTACSPNPLLFPSLSETIEAFWDAALRGPLIDRTLTSLQVLATGYAAGLAIAAVFATLAVSTRAGTDLLSTLTAM